VLLKHPGFVPFLKLLLKPANPGEILGVVRSPTVSKLIAGFSTAGRKGTSSDSRARRNEGFYAERLFPPCKVGGRSA